MGVFCVWQQAEAEHYLKVQQGKATKDTPLAIMELRHSLRNTEKVVDNNLELFEAQRVEDVKVVITMLTFHGNKFQDVLRSWLCVLRCRPWRLQLLPPTPNDMCYHALTGSSNIELRSPWKVIAD